MKMRYPGEVVPLADADYSAPIVTGTDNDVGWTFGSTAEGHISTPATDCVDNNHGRVLCHIDTNHGREFSSPTNDNTINNWHSRREGNDGVFAPTTVRGSEVLSTEPPLHLHTPKPQPTLEPMPGMGDATTRPMVLTTPVVPTDTCYDAGVTHDATNKISGLGINHYKANAFSIVEKLSWIDCPPTSPFKVVTMDVPTIAPSTMSSFTWHTSASSIDLDPIMNTLSFAEVLSWIKKAGFAYLDPTISKFSIVEALSYEGLQYQL